MKKISFIILLLLLLAGCLPKESLIEIPEGQSIEDALPRQGTAVLYFGRDSCPHCKKFFPKLKMVMKKQRKTLYYYDIDKHREDKQFVKELKNFNVVQIPFLVIYKNKTIITTLMGDKSEKEIEIFIKQAL